MPFFPFLTIFLACFYLFLPDSHPKHYQNTTKSAYFLHVFAWLFERFCDFRWYQTFLNPWNLRNFATFVRFTLGISQILASYSGFMKCLRSLVIPVWPRDSPIAEYSTLTCTCFWTKMNRVSGVFSLFSRNLDHFYALSFSQWYIPAWSTLFSLFFQKLGRIVAEYIDEKIRKNPKITTLSGLYPLVVPCCTFWSAIQWFKIPITQR